jgi:hypothetical protein
MVSYAAKMNKSLVGSLSLVSLVALALLAGCPSDDAAVDASFAAPCQAGQPGVRVHLTFAESLGGPPSWNASDPALTIKTTGAAETLGFRVNPASVNTQRQALANIAYPAGTVVGPATVDFYAIAGGTLQWEGDDATFTAEPDACVDVNLNVRFVDITDAGVGDDAAP